MLLLGIVGGRLLSSRLRALRVVAVTLLLGVMVGDLAVDAGCDPLTPHQGTQAVSSALDEDGRAGSFVSGCVPDCFCCSHTLGPTPRVLPPAPSGVEPALATPAPALPSGLRALTDHPPRVRG